MLINDKALRHWIDHFYGYGSWDARFWFIGYEESGGDLPEEVADKFNFFQKNYPETDATLCNIREVYRRVSFHSEGPKADLFRNRFEYRFDANAIQNSIWKNLIAFTHGYLNETVPDPLTYQRQFFASPAERKEALISLYPLPSPHNHAWYYSWLDMPKFDFLKSRVRYQEHVYAGRIHCILTKIKTYRPDVVLMYGMTNINALKKSVQEFFPESTFKMIKGTKLQTPQSHRADLNGTTLLITSQIPALRHNRIETGFDWEKFGKMMSAENK
jgi:hypothetical protein